MTYRTKKRIDTAFKSCRTRYGLKLSFNKGKISGAIIENGQRLSFSGRTLSYVIGKYQEYIK